MPKKPIPFMIKRRVNQIIHEEIRTARNIEVVNITTERIQQSLQCFSVNY